MGQRLIDANALDLEREVEMADDWKTAHEIANCVKYAPTVFTIPENPTNGDMIKALFPNAEIFRREEYDYPYVYVTIKDMGNCWKIRGEWWDAPYKENDNGTNNKDT